MPEKVEDYELARTHGAKAIHLMKLGKKKSDFSTMVCTGKVLKNPEEFELDLALITCKNCLRNPIYKELSGEIDGAVESKEEKKVDMIPEAGVITQTIDDEFKQNHTRVFSASTKNQKPLFTVVADNFEDAKEKIEAEKKKSNGKLKTWQVWDRGGNVIIQRWVPNEMIKGILSKEEKSLIQSVRTLDIRTDVKRIADALESQIKIMSDFTVTIAKATETIVKLMYFGNKGVIDQGIESEEEVKTKRIVKKSSRKIFKR